MNTQSHSRSASRTRPTAQPRRGSQPSRRHRSHNPEGHNQYSSGANGRSLSSGLQDRADYGRFDSPSDGRSGANDDDQYLGENDRYAQASDDLDDDEGSPRSDRH